MKLFAALVMLIDHIGYVFSPWLSRDLVMTLRSIGRLAFPLFAYFVALGFRRTKNIYRYFLRLAAFAAVTELLWCVGFPIAGLNKGASNVLFTFIAALTLLTGFELATRSTLDVIGRLELLPEGWPDASEPFYQVRLNLGNFSFPPWLGFLVGLIMMAISCLFVILIDSDYGLYGVFTVFAFYLGQILVPAEKRRRQFLVTLGLLLFVNVATWFIRSRLTHGYFADTQFLSLFAVPVIWLWPPQKKERRSGFRYSFYLFYPLHLFILLLLRFLLKRL